MDILYTYSDYFLIKVSKKLMFEWKIELSNFTD